MLHRIAQVLLVIGVSIFIAGCPKSELTDYRLIPPVDEKGQQCVQMCKESQDQCEKQCHPEGYECMKKARVDYVRYQDQQAMAERPVTLSLNDFYNQKSCTVKDCHCRVDYRSCFEICGGAIVAS